MGRAYSHNLRQKVMQAIELNGYKKSTVSGVFYISRNTIHLWCQRKIAAGSVQAKPRAKGSQPQKLRIGMSFGHL